MIPIIVGTWFWLVVLFIYLVRKLPEKYGWHCIVLMYILIFWLPVTIGISKIKPTIETKTIVKEVPVEIKDITSKQQIAKFLSEYPKYKRWFK